MLIETRDVAFLLVLKRLGLAAISTLALVGVVGLTALFAGGESEGGDPTHGAGIVQGR